MSEEKSGRVSIIVPTYNQARYLSACLDSVWFQEWPDLEVLVVDDGSTDGTQDILEEFQRAVHEDTASYAARYNARERCVERIVHRRYPEQGRLLRIISHNQNRGLSEALNTGVTAATGEFCTFVASDDIILPHMVFSLVHEIRTHHADFAYADMFIVDDLMHIIRRFSLPEYSFERSFCDWYLCGVAKLYKRELHQRYGLFDPGVHAQDHELFLRFAMGGAKFVHLPHVLAFVRAHGGERKVDNHSPAKEGLQYAESAELALKARDFFKRNMLSPPAIHTGRRTAPRVSVIIPAYNQGGYLHEALESVIAQDSDMEVLVVDDGSTDITSDILSGWASHVRILREDHSGLAAARNTGLRAACGEYVLFLDADDLLGNRVVERQLAFLDVEPPNTVAVCRNRLFQRYGEDRAPSVVGEWRLFRQHLGVHLCHFNIAPVHAFLLPRALALAAGGFDETLPACEDHEFWLRVLAVGGIFQAHPGCEVYYRRHEASLSSDTRRQNAADAGLRPVIASRRMSIPSLGYCQRAACLADAAGCGLCAIRMASQGTALVANLLELADEAFQSAVSHASILPDEEAYFLSRFITFSAYFSSKYSERFQKLYNMSISFFQEEYPDLLNMIIKSNMEKMLQKMCFMAKE